MNHIRIALCAALFAAAFAAAARGEESVDVRALQAKLAAQEAILTDLEARANYRGSANANYGGAPEAIVSLNKNALVTVGGQVNTRYFYHSGKIDSVYQNDDATAGSPAALGDGVYRRRGTISEGDLTITDAKLYVDVQVNDHFDAFLQVDLQSSWTGASDNAEKYYVRWKNICNSGFGIKVGRDGMVFGEDFAVGILADYSKSGDGAFKDATWGGLSRNPIGRRLELDTGGNILGIEHNWWDVARVTQITPYWEFCDGKFSAEISLFQLPGLLGASISSREEDRIYIDGHKYKSRNYGTSVSGRLRWKPIEGLTLSASAVNFHDDAKDRNNLTAAERNSRSKNNTAVDLAFQYRPCFLPALKVWGQFIYGWDVAGQKDMDAYTISYGASYDFCERWTVFASGDWLAAKDTYDTINDRATAWAVYGGLRYVFPYGVDIEAGWKHEEMKFRENMLDPVNLVRGGPRRTTIKGKADTVYAHLGFTF